MEEIKFVYISRRALRNKELYLETEHDDMVEWIPERKFEFYGDNGQQMEEVYIHDPATTGPPEGLPKDYMAEALQTWVRKLNKQDRKS